jgi:hypothetical protein
MMDMIDHGLTMAEQEGLVVKHSNGPFETPEETEARQKAEKLAQLAEATGNSKTEEPKKKGLAALLDMVMDESKVETLGDGNWIVENVIAEGSIVVVAGQPGAGKTLLMTYMCREMSAAGCTVVYVNADTNNADAKRHWYDAKKHNYHLITPDMEGSVELAKKAVYEMADGTDDLTGYVIILDTLKKFVNNMNDKTSVKELFNMCRRLQGNGATVVLLAHTNKYLGDDGCPVFEGVGDVKSDTDDLLYLIPSPYKPDGSMTVSTKPDKQRKDFEAISFNVSPKPERIVTKLDAFEDTTVMVQRTALIEDRAEELAIIKQVIEEGRCKQAEIVEAVKTGYLGKDSEERTMAISRRVVTQLLNNLSNEPLQQFWVRRGMGNNIKMYATSENWQW